MVVFNRINYKIYIRVVKILKLATLFLLLKIFNQTLILIY